MVLIELALPQPRVSRRAPSAASVRRRKAAKPLSFATSLQRARTVEETLSLTAQFSPDGADAVSNYRVPTGRVASEPHSAQCRSQNVTHQKPPDRAGHP